jgi:hypothetical protein
MEKENTGMGAVRWFRDEDSAVFDTRWETYGFGMFWKAFERHSFNVVDVQRGGCQLLNTARLYLVFALVEKIDNQTPCAAFGIEAVRMGLFT